MDMEPIKMELISSSLMMNLIINKCQL